MMALHAESPYTYPLIVCALGRLERSTTLLSSVSAQDGEFCRYSVTLGLIVVTNWHIKRSSRLRLTSLTLTDNTCSPQYSSLHPPSCIQQARSMFTTNFSPHRGMACSLLTFHLMTDLSAEFVVLTERRRVEAGKARKLQVGWVMAALSMHSPCPL